MGKISYLPSGDDLSAGNRVRVTGRNARGFVEFQFSMGDPSLYLEMTLPESAFQEFCQTHNAVHLSAEQARQVDEDEQRWRFGDNADKTTPRPS